MLCRITIAFVEDLEINVLIDKLCLKPCGYCHHSRKRCLYCQQLWQEKGVTLIKSSLIGQMCLHGSVVNLAYIQLFFKHNLFFLILHLLCTLISNNCTETINCKLFTLCSGINERPLDFKGHFDFICCLVGPFM